LVNDAMRSCSPGRHLGLRWRGQPTAAPGDAGIVSARPLRPCRSVGCRRGGSKRVCGTCRVEDGSTSARTPSPKPAAGRTAMAMIQQRRPRWRSFIIDGKRRSSPADQSQNVITVYAKEGDGRRSERHQAHSSSTTDTHRIPGRGGRSSSWAQTCPFCELG